MNEMLRLRPAVDRLLRSPLAPAPPMAEVRRRGAMIRRRRRAALATAAALTATMAVALPVGLLDDSGTQTVPIVTPVSPPVTTVPADPADRVAPGLLGGRDEPSRSEPGPASGAPDRGTDLTKDDHAAWEDPWAPDRQQDPGEGCRVWSEPDRGTDVGPGGVNSGPGKGPRTCSYQASRIGGYEGSGTWTIEIVRGDQRIRISSIDAPPCADGVVQAGDLVRVQLGAAEGPIAASAGSGRWHLSVGTFAGCG